MSIISRHTALATALVALSGCAGLSYQDRGPNAEPVEALVGTRAPTFEKYRTPLEAEVVDRTFNTKEAMFLANEMNIASFPFFEQAIIDGLVTSDPDFLYMTTVESYWYSRYNMSALITESRLGVHTVFGPYVTERALREGRGNVNRDRGDYVRSNKGVLLQEIIPSYLSLTGFPRRFEDASPTMLQFASGDPHYVRTLDKGIKFESTENLMRYKDLRKIYGDQLPQSEYGMGIGGNEMWKTRINYRENFLSLRWNHSKMDHTIDMGAEGQTLMKQALWMEYFFKQNHHRGRFLGNDPEEGFRGSMLNLMAVSKMLMLKSALLYDGRKLTGVDPRVAEPGEYYFPHRIGVRMRMVGDLPPRPEEFRVTDRSSQLFDQGSLLWGLSEYYYFADPTDKNNWNNVFGDNTPYDGSVMEQKYIVLAEGLANLVLHNMASMHRNDDGTLLSEWHPASGKGSKVATADLAMAMVGLANYATRVHGDSDNVSLSRQVLRDQANFLMNKLESSDGRVANGYDFSAGRPSAGPTTLLAQSFAVRGLIEANRVLGDQQYLDAAIRSYGFMNTKLWDERTGVYRSYVDAEVTEYTPLNVGAALAAVREIALVTKSAAELERWKRFWVQAIDGSGIQQSEYEETGEKNFYAKDGDGDGIPRMEYADGKYGIAPVFATKVLIQTPVSRIAKSLTGSR